MKLKALFSGMGSWHLGHTAREFSHLDALVGFWTSGSKRNGVPEEYYRRVWDYHIAQKLFYHLPFQRLEEDMRWINLPFYERWVARQSLPEGTNVVQGPMGSCEALFKLADRSKTTVLKVFDAPNSHPTTLVGYWQRECDLFASGERVPMCLSARSRINRELEVADVVLCPSNFVRDTMVLNGIPEEKCFVAHFGVDTSIFVPRAKPPEVPTFVSVGSICLRKGHQYLFRAFEKLKQRIPNARLICVGGVRPDFKEEWKRWEGTFEHRQSLSHPEVAELLASATAFVLTSVEEGFARVLSEAMACALPLVVTYETGATTVIRDGEEGIVVPARNVDAIEDAMYSLAVDPVKNEEMGRKALIVGGESNTWADYAKRLYNEYERRLELL